MTQERDPFFDPEGRPNEASELREDPELNEERLPMGDFVPDGLDDEENVQPGSTARDAEEEALRITTDGAA